MSDTMANIFLCLETYTYATSKGSHTPKIHSIELNGPVIVHLLKPIGADNFEDDAQQVFLQYPTSKRSSRIEIIIMGYKSHRKCKLTRVSQYWCTVDLLPNKVKRGPLLAVESCTQKSCTQRKSRYTYYTPRAQKLPWMTTIMLCWCWHWIGAPSIFDKWL